uniref:Uncharacterized protein n=1 Tax=Solanum lycopersicum TaxID=4081 RepID=A0A3Q7HYS9_SOLLC
DRIEFMILHSNLKLKLKGHCRIFILIKARSVNSIKRPNQTKDSKKDPTKKIITEPKWKPSSFCTHSFIH